MSIRKGAWFLSGMLFLFAGHSSAVADSEVDALRKQVGKQQTVIDQMQSTLSELTKEHNQTKEKLENVSTVNE